MKRNLILLATGAMAIGLVAAGCGSSSNSNSTSTSSLTKAEFLAKGNAICKAGNVEINNAANSSFKNQKPSQATLTTFATQTIIPSVQKQVDQIKALGAPAGDEAQVNAIVNAAQADLEKVKANPSLIQGDPFADANKLANAYGLTECGSSSGG